MQCDKIPYQNYKEAQGHLKGLRERRSSRDQYYAYKCDDCGMFHVATRHKNKLEKPMKELKYKKIEVEYTPPKKKADPLNKPRNYNPKPFYPSPSVGRVFKGLDIK